MTPEQIRRLRLDPQAARSMNDKRLRLENSWFYEEPEGISIYMQTDAGIHSALIPLRSIRDYMGRINDT